MKEVETSKVSRKLSYLEVVWSQSFRPTSETSLMSGLLHDLLTFTIFRLISRFTQFKKKVMVKVLAMIPWDLQADQENRKLEQYQENVGSDQLILEASSAGLVPAGTTTLLVNPCVGSAMNLVGWSLVF